MAGRSAFAAVLTAIVFGIVLIAGVVVMGGFFEHAPEVDNAAVEQYEEPNTWITVGNGRERGINEQVWDSTGYAARLDGSDSFASTASIEWTSGDEWTISAWGAASSDASGERALLSMDGRTVVTYNASSDEWRAWYYDESSTDSWDVTVSATAQPSTLENVQVRRNATHMVLSAGTSGGSVNTATVELAANTTADAPDAGNWIGRVDEVRTFDDRLNQSQHDGLRNDPIAAVPGGNQTARIMFDEFWRQDGQQSLFDARGEVELNGADLVRSGVGGTTMERGTDYQWRESGPEVRPLSTGDLADDEIVYVGWDNSETGVNDIQDAWLDFVELAATLMLILVVATILGIVRRMQG